MTMIHRFESKLFHLFIPSNNNKENKMKRESELVVSWLLVVPELERIVDEKDWPYLQSCRLRREMTRVETEQIRLLENASYHVQIRSCNWNYIMIAQILGNREEGETTPFGGMTMVGDVARLDLWLTPGHRAARQEHAGIWWRPPWTLAWQRHRSIGTTIAADSEVRMVALQNWWGNYWFVWDESGWRRQRTVGNKEEMKSVVDW